MSDILGVIGAITGIAGAIMGGIAYRQVNKMKALDLRVELRKLANECQLLANDMESHIEHAQRSHQAVASATGSFQSGAMTLWLAECESDLTYARQLIAAVATTGGGQMELNQAQLEVVLGEAHANFGKLSKLRQKYDASIADDDQRRSELRKAAAARVAPRAKG